MWKSLLRPSRRILPLPSGAEALLPLGPENWFDFSAKASSPISCGERARSRFDDAGRMCQVVAGGREKIAAPDLREQDFLKFQASGPMFPGRNHISQFAAATGNDNLTTGSFGLQFHHCVEHESALLFRPNLTTGSAAQAPFSSLLVPDVILRSLKREYSGNLTGVRMAHVDAPRWPVPTPNPRKGGPVPNSGGQKEKGSGKEPASTGPRLNRKITAPYVRLVTEEGHGILTRAEALQKAADAGLDLMEVDARPNPPVCRLVDHKHFVFESRKKEKENRKKQADNRRQGELKDVRISPRTCMLLYHGTETRSEAGTQRLAELLKLLEDDAQTETPVRDEGHKVWCIVKTRVGRRKQASKPVENSVLEGENDPEVSSVAES